MIEAGLKCVQGKAIVNWIGLKEDEAKFTRRRSPWIVLDLVMYHLVGDVTICYRCLSQMRGAGTNPDGRYRPFDLAIGERYRQERMRIEQLRERGAEAEPDK